MATVYGIQKSVTLDTGLTFDHWAFHTASLNSGSQSATIMLVAYKDFASRLQGKKPISGQTVMFTMTFAELGLDAPMTNPVEELANTVLTYALANAEELSGGQIVSQQI